MICVLPNVREGMTIGNLVPIMAAKLYARHFKVKFLLLPDYNPRSALAENKRVAEGDYDRWLKGAVETLSVLGLEPDVAPTFNDLEEWNVDVPVSCPDTVLDRAYTCCCRDCPVPLVYPFDPCMEKKLPRTEGSVLMLKSEGIKIGVWKNRGPFIYDYIPHISFISNAGATIVVRGGHLREFSEAEGIVKSKLKDIYWPERSLPWTLHVPTIMQSTVKVTKSLGGYSADRAIVDIGKNKLLEVLWFVLQYQKPPDDFDAMCAAFDIGRVHSQDIELKYLLRTGGRPDIVNDVYNFNLDQV